MEQEEQEAGGWGAEMEEKEEEGVTQPGFLPCSVTGEKSAAAAVTGALASFARPAPPQGHPPKRAWRRCWWRGQGMEGGWGWGQRRGLVDW